MSPEALPHVRRFGAQMVTLMLHGWVVRPEPVICARLSNQSHPLGRDGLPRVMWVMCEL